MRLIEQLTGGPFHFATGLSFTFVILPVFLAGYRLLPKKFRAAYLALFSAALYFLAEPAGLPLMAVCVLLDYAAVRVMRAYEGRRDIERLCMWFSVVKGTAVIIIAGVLTYKNGAPLMLGTFVYTLSGIEAVIGAYKKEYICGVGIVRFTAYCCFFLRLFAGPLYTYKDFVDGLENPVYERKRLFGGFYAYTSGLFKASIFGGGLAALYLELCAFTRGEESVLYGWTLITVFALAVYYILCGLSEMAGGAGIMLGFNMPRNFYYPYQSPSMTDFPDRFNMTFTAMIKKRVCGILERNGKRTDFLCILLTGVLAGLWFGLRFSGLLWGLYLAFFMLMERYVYGKAMEYVPTLINRAFTLCATVFGLIILSSKSMEGSAGLVRLMLAFGSNEIPLYTKKIMYSLSSNWLLLVLACFFASSLTDLASRWAGKNLPTFSMAIGAAASVCILILFAAISLWKGMAPV